MRDGALDAKALRPWIVAFRTMTLALPALTILVLITIYSVNVPFWDEWDEVPRLLEKMHAGTLGLTDFFAQHNEHRIVFPRLIMFGLALLTHWNIKAELVTSWLLACGCAYNLWRLSQLTGFRGSNASFWLLLAANILLFTPLQGDNWLWGFQIGFFLPLTAFTSLLWIIPSSRTSVAFLAAIALSTIVAFSIGSGFITWLLALLLLLFPNGKLAWQARKRWLVLFLLVFLSSQILYLWGYHKPAQHPNTLMAIHHPGKFIEYILMYFGSPFAEGTKFRAVNVAMIPGAILLILFCACITYLFSRRNDYSFVKRTLPWATLCLFALGNSIITAIGRMGFGTDQALASRYITFSVMMPIGLLFLTRLVFVHWREKSASKHYVKEVSGDVVFASATLLALLLTLSSFASLKLWAQSRHDRICGKALVQLVNVVQDSNAFTRYVHPAAAYTEVCKEMDRLGYLHPPLLKTRFIREIAKAPTSQAATSGYFQISQSSASRFTVSGWSGLPERKEAAVATLLTYDDDHGEANIFAITFENVPRPTYPGSGWSSTIDTNGLPPGRRTIRAWAFNPETCRAYQLAGTKAITVTQ
jgi:hypothetical protein